MLHPQGDALLRARKEEEYGKPSFREIAPGVWFALAMAPSNAIVLEGNTGCILIDTFESPEGGQHLKEAIARHIGKPVHTIIYTHSHPDHIGGSPAFADTAREIIAFRSQSAPPPGHSVLGPVFAKRAVCQFGSVLPPEFHFLKGTEYRSPETPPPSTPSAPLTPTTYYDTDVVNRVIDGIELELHYTPGETDDTCFVWLAEQRILACGDTYYAYFPNLYALRGTAYREVAHWITALDKLLSMNAELLLPGHTDPVVGKDKVHEVLSNYRAAMAFVYDETLACLAKDMTIEEAVETVVLPDHLRDLPYLREFYGTVAWSVRSIYTGHVGWFDGNPSSLEPLRLSERARRVIALAGGDDAFRQTIGDALTAGDWQWAAELCDHLLALDKNDTAARLQKAQALNALARLETSPNGRNYYLVTAHILNGDLPENLIG